MTMRIVALVACLVGGALGLTGKASAEVDKFMRTGDGQMQAEFRLKFKPPARWTEDQNASRKNGLPIFVPNGTTFANAPALMYIKVTYNSDHRSTDKFVEVAHQRWQSSVSDVKIVALSEETRNNGLEPFRIYHFVNPSKPQQAYELMAYGVDTDKDGNNYFLMIGLTAATQKAIDGAEASFRAALHAH